MKDNLRSKLKAARSRLPSQQASDKSRVICERLWKSVEWSKIKKVHIYKSEPSWNEVDTSYIIERLAEDWPKVKIVSPALDKRQTLPTELFDLVIVPVLGFDKQKYRLGLGAGFYDRFLAKQPRAVKVGLAYHSSLVENLPREPHDIPLDAIITEDSIIGKI